jgi:hypothetical protein
VSTEHRPVPLPQAAVPAAPVPGQKPKIPVPAGAAKMQAWYIDPAGRRVRTQHPVPVDADDMRTAHLRHQCPQCDHHEWLLPGAARFCPTHGKPLVAPKVASRARAVAVDGGQRFGRAATPWLLPAAAAVADIVASHAQVGGWAAATVPAFGAAAYVVTRRTLTRRAVKRGRIERGQRTGRRVRQIVRQARGNALVGVEAGGWLMAMALTDLSGWPGRVVWGAALARWALAVKPWWDAIETRRTRSVVPKPTGGGPVGQEAQSPDPVRERAVTTWANLIGGTNGPLAGTRLEQVTRLPACAVDASGRTRLPNWSAKVTAVVPGSINMRETRPTLLGRIAAAYGCTYADVAFTADEADLGVAWLRVQPDNVLAEVRMWQGPDAANDWKRGLSRIGRFEDRRGIPYQWWTGTGAAHDLISGCTGSGKSELVAQLILDSLHSNGLVLDWVGDPQGGQSYGVLKDAVDWFARDKTEITLMLLAALKEMLRRNDDLSDRNVKTWAPSKAMPLLVVTLDEVQSYIEDPVILDLVEKLVAMGRKCGIKVRLITQVPAAYNLGGSTYIKEQLKSGQTLIFRAMTDIAGRSAVEGDCPVDPTMLPMKWGPGTCNAGETTAGLLFVQGLHARDVYGRTDWTGQDMGVWLTDSSGASTLSPGGFSREAQLVSGVLWGDRRARARRALLAGRSDADLLPGGKAVELIEAAAVSAANDTVVQFTPVGAQVPDRARDVVLAAAREAADAGGVVQRRQIVASTPDMKDGTRNAALTDLLAAGQLRRIKNGVFAVPVTGYAREESGAA